VRIRLLCVGLSIACGSPPGVDGGAPDAGRDAGTFDAGFDAGVDAGTDAGAFDAGFDAGVDAGIEDAGFDAGFDAGVDAGIEDAGVDAGFDAGEPFDAGVITYDDAGCILPWGAGAPFNLRVMAANLTSGSGQTYDPGHGLRIIQGLKPDVVMIQELNYGANTPADFARLVAVLDGGHVYTRGSGLIPTGVLSRFPIIDAGEWPDPQVGNRGFTWAELDLPGPRDLYVVSVHLLTSSASERNAEAVALLARLGANVPPSSFLLVGGDFNAETVNEAAFTTLSSRVTEGFPPPSDQQGNPNTNAPRSRPYDHVLVSQCLRPSQAGAGLVFDSRVYTPLSAVPPVLFGDSAAAGMQHMAVVKDFVIQP